MRKVKIDPDWFLQLRKDATSGLHLIYILILVMCPIYTAYPIKLIIMINLMAIYI